MVNREKIQKIHLYLQGLAGQDLPEKGVIAGGSVANLYAYGKRERDLVNDIDVFCDEWPEGFEDKKDGETDRYDFESARKGIVNVVRTPAIKNGLQDLLYTFDLNCTRLAYSYDRDKVLDVWVDKSYSWFLKHRVILCRDPDRIKNRRIGYVLRKTELLVKHGIARGAILKEGAWGGCYDVDLCVILNGRTELIEGVI